jgi:hypothetical protein
VSRCRCGSEGVFECGCSAADSDCIDVTGAGTSANPFSFSPILDSDPDNLLSCGASGLLADLPALIKNPPRCKLRRNVDMTVPSATEQLVEYNLVDYDSAGMFNPSDGFRLNIVADGLYEVKFAGRWYPNNIGGRRTHLTIQPDGIIFVVTTQAATIHVGDHTRYTGSTDIELTSGQWITTTVYQDCGADLVYMARSEAPTMLARWVAPLDV